jgi:hypothetical protein
MRGTRVKAMLYGQRTRLSSKTFERRAQLKQSELDRQTRLQDIRASLFSEEDLDKILKSKAKLPRPAAKHNINSRQLAEIRARCRRNSPRPADEYKAALEIIYPVGEKIKLIEFAPGSEPGGQNIPQPGQTGQIFGYSLFSQQVKIEVDWDNPKINKLDLLVGKDTFVIE